MNKHGYSGNYDMVTNLAQTLLLVRGLEALLNERQAQDIKKKTLRSIFMIAQFLVICPFDIQSGWRDAFESQSEYTRIDLLWENSNQKISIKYSKI
jgi:hypothetical protein